MGRHIEKQYNEVIKKKDIGTDLRNSSYVMVSNGSDAESDTDIRFSKTNIWQLIADLRQIICCIRKIHN